MRLIVKLDVFPNRENHIVVKTGSTNRKNIRIVVPFIFDSVGLRPTESFSFPIHSAKRMAGLADFYKRRRSWKVL